MNVNSKGKPSNEKVIPVSLAVCLKHPSRRAKVQSLGNRIALINAKISQLTAEKKPLMREIVELSEEYGLPKSVDGGEWFLHHTISVREEILKERLVEKGVSSEIIDFATKINVTEKRSVTRKKKKNGSDGNADNEEG